MSTSMFESFKVFFKFQRRIDVDSVALFTDRTVEDDQVGKFSLLI